MNKINNTKEMFAVKIQALYDIEKELERALPKMEKAASSPVLKRAFRNHYDETIEHSRRLEEIFDLLDLKASRIKVEGIRGIISDSDWVNEEVDTNKDIRDSMLASAARYAEHYEMAGYKSALEEARYLGFDEAADLLLETYGEEEMADEVLEDIMKENLEMAMDSAGYEEL